MKMGGGSEKEKHRNRAAGKSHLGKRHNKEDIGRATVSQGWDRDHQSYSENTGVLSKRPCPSPPK